MTLNHSKVVIYTNINTQKVTLRPFQHPGGGRGGPPKGGFFAQLTTLASYVTN